KAYLFQVDEKGDILPNDKQKLSQLNAEGTKAPYHLINVALNLQNSDDPELRGRACDFFIFSKHFVGSVRTGFCPTATMETFDRHLGLGTAMAISGAAAAPNMGTSTIKSLVFILALLNIRLGYWLPNPFVQRKPWYLRGPLLGVGPLFLMKEFFSKIDEKSRYVNLSDGGHIENLGVYELLRRRCKFIIACDGEADPDLRFASLVKLIRFARIDMGIDIEINLADLRKQQTRLSSQHGAMGKIHYSKDETGYLLYIKASITGDENVYIRDYQQRHPLFPHESTADQFFDEAQFEVYRALGHHVVKKLNIDIIKTQTRKGQRNGDEIEQLFATLETQLQPRTSPP
ncbi:MAG: hypothetical protein ONA90_02915, partial [candidate division KSB1 bacterium]|nr:hypothetical protein [candidate division KSB1 bacterium]